MQGKKYGRLTVIERAGSNKEGKAEWMCVCECGNKRVFVGKYFRVGHTKSCGCYNIDMIIKRNKESAKMKGWATSRIYNTWYNMLRRCQKDNRKDGRWYRDKGISVCDEWQNFFIFKRWAFANGYNKDLTLDRIDGDGNYEPSNCRWATWEQQANNRSSNRFLKIGDENKTVAQWAKAYAICPQMILSRLRHGYDGLDLLKPSGALRK